MMEPKCPHLKIKRTYYEPMDEVFEGYLCTLNNKACLMETDMECETYNEWLKEDKMECPICELGVLVQGCGLIICCHCRKAWLLHEFIGDCREAGIEVIIKEEQNGTNQPTIQPMPQL